MDSSAEEFRIVEEGICNFCFDAQKALSEVAKTKYDGLIPAIEQIKKDGVGKDYDCLIGLSGGIDSSTTLHYAVQMGLRPLCYTVDNGWNKPVADENIMKLVEALKVPFYRKTIDYDTFLKLQMAFIKAGVPNIEIPSDHMILATSLELARQYNIKWFISGGNVASESIMPPSWGYNARDLTHIKAIYKYATGDKLTGLPLCGTWKWNWYKWVSGIKTLYLLDYTYYNIKASKKLLGNLYGWQDYGEKHEESKFTHWFQAYYLPNKFGFDKRKAHFSSLINSSQMTRDEALELLKTPREYPDLIFKEKSLFYPKNKHERFKMDKWYGRIAKFVKLWNF